MNKKIFHTLFAPKINLPPKPKIVPVRYNIFTGSGFSGFGASEEELENSYTRGFEDSQGFYESLLNKKILDDPKISGSSLINSTINSPIKIPPKIIYDPYLDNSVSQMPSNAPSRQITRTNSLDTLGSQVETFVTSDRKLVEEKFRRDPKIINQVREQIDSMNLPAKDIPKAIKNKMDQLAKSEAEKYIERVEKIYAKAHKKEIKTKVAEKKSTKNRNPKGLAVNDDSLFEDKSELYKDDTNLLEKSDMYDDNTNLLNVKPVPKPKTLSEFQILRAKLAKDDKNIPESFFSNFYNSVKNQPEELTQESWNSFKDLNGFFAVPGAAGKNNNIGFANEVIKNINRVNNKNGIHFETITKSNIDSTRPPLVKFLRENGFNLKMLTKIVDNGLPILPKPKQSPKPQKKLPELKQSTKTQKKLVKDFSSEIEVTNKPKNKQSNENKKLFKIPLPNDDDL